MEKGCCWAIVCFQWCHRYPHFFPKTSGFRFFLYIIMSQLRINCKVWHTLRFWVVCLASVRLKRYKEAFVTFEVLAYASANNWVILDVRRMSPHGWKYFWLCFRNELEALGEKNLEELGSWLCSRETCLQSILTEPGPMSLVGGTRVDFPLASGHLGVFSTYPVVVIVTTYLVKMRHHENRLRPNEIW